MSKLEGVNEQLAAHIHVCGECFCEQCGDCLVCYGEDDCGDLEDVAHSGCGDAEKVRTVTERRT